MLALPFSTRRHRRPACGRGAVPQRPRRESVWGGKRVSVCDCMCICVCTEGWAGGSTWKGAGPPVSMSRVRVLPGRMRFLLCRFIWCVIGATVSHNTVVHGVAKDLESKYLENRYNRMDVNAFTASSHSFNPSATVTNSLPRMIFCFS